MIATQHRLTAVLSSMVVARGNGKIPGIFPPVEVLVT